MDKAPITAEELRQLMHYEPETGVFTWTKTVARNVKAGSKIDPLRNHGHYVQTMIRKKPYYLHRLAWLYTHGVWPQGMIDHIDGNKCNNALANLRDVSRSVNGQNQKEAMSRNKIGLLGVSQVGARYRALIAGCDGKQVYLGTFDDPQEASAVYINAKRQLHAGCTI